MTALAAPFGSELIVYLLVECLQHVTLLPSSIKHLDVSSNDLCGLYPYVWDSKPEAVGEYNPTGITALATAVASSRAIVTLDVRGNEVKIKHKRDITGVLLCQDRSMRLLI